MRKALVTIFLLTMMGGMAWAGPFGPVESTLQPGQFSVGLGGFYSDMKWKSRLAVSGVTLGDVTTKSFQEFLQASIGVAPGWEIYGRVGGASMKMNDNTFTYNDAMRVYGGLGAKGLFWSDKTYGIGAFAQGNMYSDHKGHDMGIVAGNGVFVQGELKSQYDVAAGLIGQMKLQSATLYLGPFWYYGHAKLSVAALNIGASGSDTLKEKTSVGGVLGVGIPLTKAIDLSVEAQVRDRVSGGAVFSHRF